jgi:uncharacterized protein
MDRVTRALADSSYMLLTTFRRDGTPVPTPVWVVGDGSSLAVGTTRGTGKVKRIRRDGAVELAPCNVRGRPFGEPVRGRARLLDDEETERIQHLLIRKYGLRARLADALVRRRSDQPVGLSIIVN